MKKLVFAALLSLAACSTLFAQSKFDYSRDFKPILAETKDAKSNLFYGKLLKRFKDDDTTMTRAEILSLLIGFTDKPEYKPYDIVETERLIYSLNDEGKYQQAHDTAILLLKTYPFSFQGLKEMSYAIGKLGKEDSSAYYLDLVAKIMMAMVYSGDGMSPETAMFALGPADGQHLIKGAGFGIGTMGSGNDKNGNFLDILGATKDGHSKTMYFNIQHATLKMFGGKSAEDLLNEYNQDKTKKEKAGKKKSDK